MSTGLLTVTDRSGGSASRSISLAFASELAALAARREVLPTGEFYPGYDDMTGLLFPVAPTYRNQGAPPPGFVFEDGVSDGLGGRVFNIPQNYVARNTVFRCAVVKPASTTSQPRFWNCWIAGNNPDLIWQQRNSRPQKNAAGTLQWSSSVPLTNFTGIPVLLEHSVVDPGYWRWHEGADLWATMWSFGSWGGNVLARYSRLEGAADNFNHAGAPGAKDDGSGQFTHLYRCRMGETFWCNQLQDTEFYTVQDNPTDPRGGAVHADGAVQISTNGNVLVEECLSGGPHEKAGPAQFIDPGPTGARLKCGRNTGALMCQEEGDTRYVAERKRVRNVRFINGWAGGGAATFNYNRKNGNALNDRISLENMRILARGVLMNGIKNESGIQVAFSDAELGVTLTNVREWNPASGPFSDTGKTVVPTII